MANCSKAQLKQACELIANRGTCRRHLKTHYVLAYHTCVWSEAELLTQVFGGYVHKHRSGWYWKLWKREDQIRAAIEIAASELVGHPPPERLDLLYGLLPE